MKPCDGESSISFSARSLSVKKTVRCPMEKGHAPPCTAHTSMTPVPGYSVSVKVEWEGPTAGGAANEGGASPPPVAVTPPRPR